jgi:hypothetical protein
MGPTGCPESSVRNYHYWLRNNPEERSSDLFGGGSLKSLFLIQLLPAFQVYFLVWTGDSGSNPERVYGDKFIDCQ